MKIEDDKFKINLKFYFFLKHLIKINFSEKQIAFILGFSHKNMESFERLLNDLGKFISIETKKGKGQETNFLQIVDQIDTDTDLKLFYFCLRLFLMKKLILELAKLRYFSNEELLRTIDPLSLEYDKLTLYRPYSTRVEGALLSLVLFDCLENDNLIVFDTKKFCSEYIKTLSKLAIELKELGVESNQVFMLALNESINQSIISDSGLNYEERIKNKLLAIGIQEEDIKKKHDVQDSSTEFDFFFTLDGKSYGIGAKRTLRERYKQFIKTPQMSKLDVMIQITLGIDLSEEKARTIREKYGVYLFVADEVYQQFRYLQQIGGVYSCNNISIELLKKL